MPTGPKGEKRPADVVSEAAKVMRIDIGEEDIVVDDGNDPAAKALGGALLAFRCGRHRFFP